MLLLQHKTFLLEEAARLCLLRVAGNCKIFKAMVSKNLIHCILKFRATLLNSFLMTELAVFHNY